MIRRENLPLRGEELPLPSVLHPFSISFLRTEPRVVHWGDATVYALDVNRH